jgi:ABC-2 type transport system ATP-binding protein
MELIANRMVIINKGKTVVEGEVSKLLSSDDLVVQLEIDKVEAAKNYLKNHLPKLEIIDSTATHLELAITKSMLPELNKSLVQQGFGVYAIESKRKLEDYFIKMLKADAVE